MYVATIQLSQTTRVNVEAATLRTTRAKQQIIILSRSIKHTVNSWVQKCTECAVFSCMLQPSSLATPPESTLRPPPCKARE